MVVGVLRFVLQIPGAGSLKGKRHVLRKVLDRVRARFNVSVAEVADNDLWQKATIGVAAVGNDRAFVNEVLDKVLRSVEEGGAEAHVVSHEMELVSIADMYGVSGSLKPERTLAEAEAAAGRVDDESRETLDESPWGDEPTLEELEAAAERLPEPPPSSARRRRR
jgi:uncharacterized protein YlxP (DUF503 family)